MTRLHVGCPKYPGSIFIVSMEKLERTTIRPLETFEPRFLSLPAPIPVSVMTELSELLPSWIVYIIIIFINCNWVVTRWQWTHWSTKGVMEEQVPEFLVYSIRYALTSSCQAVVNLRLEIPSRWDSRLIPWDRMVVKTEAMADRMNLLPKHVVLCYTSQSRGFICVGYKEEENIAKNTHWVWLVSMSTYLYKVVQIWPGLICM